jgi:hypothetical protein
VPIGVWAAAPGAASSSAAMANAGNRLASSDIAHL